MDIRSSIESYSSYSKPTLTSTQLLPKGTLAPCSCNCRSFQIKSKFQTDVQRILPWFHHRGDTSEILHDLLIFGRKQRLSEGWHARDAQCQAGTLPWVGRRGETCQNLPTTLPYDLATNDGSWSENMGTKTTSKRIVCFTRRVSFPLFSTSISLGVYIHKICAGAAFWQRPTQSLATLIPAWTWWGSLWRKMVKMGRCNYHYTTLCLNWMYLDVWFQMILSRSHKVIFVWSTWCISGIMIRTSKIHLERRQMIATWDDFNISYLVNHSCRNFTTRNSSLLVAPGTTAPRTWEVKNIGLPDSLLSRFDLIFASQLHGWMWAMGSLHGWKLTLCWFTLCYFEHLRQRSNGNQPTFMSKYVVIGFEQTAHPFRTPPPQAEGLVFLMPGAPCCL